MECARGKREPDPPVLPAPGAEPPETPHHGLSPSALVREGVEGRSVVISPQTVRTTGGDRLVEAVRDLVQVVLEEVRVDVEVIAAEA